MERDPMKRSQMMSPEEKQRWTKELSKTRRLIAGAMITSILTISSGAVDMFLYSPEQITRNVIDALAMFFGICLFVSAFNGYLNTGIERKALEKGEDPSKVRGIML